MSHPSIELPQSLYASLKHELVSKPEDSTRLDDLAEEAGGLLTSQLVCIGFECQGIPTSRIQEIDYLEDQGRNLHIDLIDMFIMGVSDCGVNGNTLLVHGNKQYIDRVSRSEDSRSFAVLKRDGSGYRSRISDSLAMKISQRPEGAVTYVPRDQFHALAPYRSGSNRYFFRAKGSFV